MAKYMEDEPMPDGTLLLVVAVISGYVLGQIGIILAALYVWSKL